MRLLDTNTWPGLLWEALWSPDHCTQESEWIPTLLCLVLLLCCQLSELIKVSSLPLYHHFYKIHPMITLLMTTECFQMFNSPNSTTTMECKVLTACAELSVCIAVSVHSWQIKPTLKFTGHFCFSWITEKELVKNKGKVCVILRVQQGLEIYLEKCFVQGLF